MPPRKKSRAKRTKQPINVESDVAEHEDLTEKVEALDSQEAAVSAAAVEEDAGEKELDLGNTQMEIKQQDEDLVTGSAEDEVCLDGGGGKSVLGTSEELEVKEDEDPEEDPEEDQTDDVHTDNVIDCVQDDDNNEKTDNVEDETATVDAGAKQEEEKDDPAVSDSTQVILCTETNLLGEGTVAASQISNAEALANNENDLVHGGHIAASSAEGTIRDVEEDDEDEAPPSTLMNDLISDRAEEKQLEIFVGRLDKSATEEDLTDVFKKFGEIKSVRVVRNQTTNRSRGFAFIQYTTAEQAKNVLSQLKEGIEVKGKKVKISACQNKSTLYLGNICKLWTKDTVLETLKGYGIENVEELHLPDDPVKEGKIKGFAFLEFTIHSDAVAAFKLLRQPTAVFGRDRSAKVSFAHTAIHPNEESLSEVKTVHLEGLPDDWNEDKVKELCAQHGEVVKVAFSRNAGSKPKFAFITFTSRESALACVEGVNNIHNKDGELKITASIAKPHSKGRLQKQGLHGGFKVNGEPGVLTTKEEGASKKDTPSAKPKPDAKSKRAKKKGKMVSEQTEKAVPKPAVTGGSKVNTSRNDNKGQLVRGSSKVEPKGLKRKKNQQSINEDSGKIRTDNGKPSKKQKGIAWGRENRNSGKQKREPRKGGPSYGSDRARYATARAPAYVASSASYPSHVQSTLAGTKRPLADMEPHAGYIEPVTQQRTRSYSGYPQPTLGLQSLYPAHSGHQETAINLQSQAHTGYRRELSYGSYVRPHSGFLESAPVRYIEPTILRQSRPLEGYYESSAAANSIRRPYDSVLRRDGRQDAAGISHSAYVTGSSLPASYVPSYSSYTRYEGGSSAGGGHYQTSGGGGAPPLTHYQTSGGGGGAPPITHYQTSGGGGAPPITHYQTSGGGAPPLTHYQTSGGGGAPPLTRRPYY